MLRQLECLGRGNFGSVWKEVDSYTGRVYATKRIPLGRTGFNDNLDEAKLMVASESRYTVKVFSAAKDGEDFVIRTEYMPNGSLEVACSSGPVNLRDFYDWFPDICRGVGHLHSRGVLHRDLKPANVLLDELRSIKIGDFGLALIKGTQPSHGQIAYIPTLTPESDAVESASGDIYALGCLAYRLLNGEPAWSEQLLQVAQGPDPMSGIRQAAKQGLFPDRKVWPPYVSSALKRVISRSLDTDPSRRYSTAFALCEAVEKTMPKYFWEASSSEGSVWLGSPKSSRENRSWRITTGNGVVTVRKSIQGGPFRKVQKACVRYDGMEAMYAVAEAIRMIEAGESG
ncbi:MULTISPECIES: serine/threonine-protein kinase [Paenarthrobacter]|uniref:serine/threonine-protein kinase n=1 Tax=Paenarthrobacter TaxID=1742992 RepID=UPI0013E308E4|nr:serine/threonine-protein kinase [Paenarthrobacter ureafaciens]